MQNNPVRIYIPNMDWDALHNSVSASTIYNHLVKFKAVLEEVAAEDATQLLQDIVLRFLDVSPEEFQHEVPLTSYGLDSLSAARLANSLKPYMTISQMQLLGDLSLEDIAAKMGDTKITAEVQETSTTEQAFAWDALGRRGETVLKLVVGSGTPLIIIHGGAGDVITFRPLQEAGMFTTPLWAIQYVFSRTTATAFSDVLQANK